jgi:hypothetical protein
MNQIVPLSPGLIELLSKPTSGGVMPFTREIFLLEIIVAGTTFCPQIEEIAPLLLPEVVLKMLRDPGNQHDEHAIGIYHGDTRIGWVPQELNLIISRLMDAGKAFFCRIVTTEWKGKWLRIKANIYMVE